MWARLVMYSYEVCTCIGKIFNIVVRLFNHEVDIQDRFRSGVPGNLDNIRTVADIGYKMAIHNITMDPFRFCVYSLFDLTPQSGKIRDRKSTRLNSSHVANSYAVTCLKKKIKQSQN